MEAAESAPPRQHGPSKAPASSRAEPARAVTTVESHAGIKAAAAAAQDYREEAAAAAALLSARGHAGLPQTPTSGNYVADNPTHMPWPGSADHWAVAGPMHGAHAAPSRSLAMQHQPHLASHLVPIWTPDPSTSAAPPPPASVPQALPPASGPAQHPRYVAVMGSYPGHPPASGAPHDHPMFAAHAAGTPSHAGHHAAMHPGMAAQVAAVQRGHHGMYSQGWSPRGPYPPVPMPHVPGSSPAHAAPPPSAAGGGGAARPGKRGREDDAPHAAEPSRAAASSPEDGAAATASTAGAEPDAPLADAHGSAVARPLGLRPRLRAPPHDGAHPHWAAPVTAGAPHLAPPGPQYAALVPVSLPHSAAQPSHLPMSALPPGSWAAVAPSIEGPDAPPRPPARGHVVASARRGGRAPGVAASAGVSPSAAGAPIDGTGIVDFAALESRGIDVSSMAMRGRETRSAAAQIPGPALRLLFGWLVANLSWPFPSRAVKEAISQATGLEQSKVKYWFSNVRKRHWVRVIANGEQPRSQMDVDLVVVAKQLALPIGAGKEEFERRFAEA